MQRQYQVCPPGLPDGMAVALAKKVLRAVQDAIPFHKTVLAEYAEETTYERLLAESCATCPITLVDMAKRTHCWLCLADMRALGHEMCMAGYVLDRRRGVGKG
jgi:hypothetical protein